VGTVWVEGWGRGGGLDNAVLRRKYRFQVWNQVCKLSNAAARLSNLINRA
jgi:hypothetical protein